MTQHTFHCPHCRSECFRDSVDVGVGVIHGPWGCPQCRWSEDERYDLRDGDKHTSSGGVIDQYGGIHPKPPGGRTQQPDREYGSPNNA